MELTQLEIEGAWLAKSKVWTDERGTFREWFRHQDLVHLTGFNFEVAQGNISVSGRGVIRGIHYSLAPGGQAKWVTCVNGSIIDIIVDIRPKSPTYGKYISIEMQAGDGLALLIGSGLGHAFISLEEKTMISYLLTSPYSPEWEHEINPFDTEISIAWPSQVTNIVLSEKDKNAPSLSDARVAGKLP